MDPPTMTPFAVDELLMSAAVVLSLGPIVSNGLDVFYVGNIRRMINPHNKAIFVDASKTWQHLPVHATPSMSNSRQPLLTRHSPMMPPGGRQTL